MIVSLINSLILMAILMSIGFYIRNKHILNDEAENALVYILVKITIPAMVINTLMIEFSYEQFKLGLSLMAVSAVFHIILVLIGEVSVIKEHNNEKSIIVKYSTVMMNGGFMGYPLINQIFGAEGMFYATMFYVPNVIFMWTYGVSLFLAKDKSKKNYKHILINPGMIGLYIGSIIYFTQVPIPPFARNLVDLLAKVTTVLSMLVIGSRIATIGIVKSFVDKKAYYAMFIRLIISPIIMIVIMKIFNFEYKLEQIFIIYSALPTATLMAIMAKSYDYGDEELASKIVVITHMISLLTIPVFVYINNII